MLCLFCPQRRPPHHPFRRLSLLASKQESAVRPNINVFRLSLEPARRLRASSQTLSRARSFTTSTPTTAKEIPISSLPSVNNVRVDTLNSLPTASVSHTTSAGGLYNSAATASTVASGLLTRASFAASLTALVSSSASTLAYSPAPISLPANVSAGSELMPSAQTPRFPSTPVSAAYDNSSREHLSARRPPSPHPFSSSSSSSVLSAATHRPSVDSLVHPDRRAYVTLSGEQQQAQQKRLASIPIPKSASSELPFGFPK